MLHSDCILFMQLYFCKKSIRQHLNKRKTKEMTIIITGTIFNKRNQSIKYTQAARREWRYNTIID